MKKFKILSFFLILILIFTGCSLKKEFLIEISYKELIQKIENQETFFFTAMQDGCSHCEEFLPKFEEILKENEIKGYKLNFTKLTDEEEKEFGSKFGSSIGTPTTIFITEGKEETQLTRIVGNQSKTKVIEKLKSMKYIK